MPLRLNHITRILNIPPRQRLFLTSLIYPDKIFSTTVPSPPTWPKPTSSPPSHNFGSSSLRWEEVKRDNKYLPGLLSALQEKLRYVHKRKIAWPVEESVCSNFPLNEYVTMLLCLIVDIFNQLHGPHVLHTPMEYIPVALGESIYGGTFLAEDFKLNDITAPIVLCLPDDLFDSHGQISSRVGYALSRALWYQPLVPSIIISNFKDIAIFFPPRGSRSEPVYERVFTTQPPLALRVISTALLLRQLPGYCRYINCPSPDFDVDAELIGPPQDPNRPLLPDEQILESHLRHSDFDLVTLAHDRARTLQFFRWHDQIRQRYSKVVARPNDIISTVANEVGMDFPRTGPIYPYDASELPAETVTYLQGIQRESLLVSAGIGELFKQAKTFTLEVDEVIAEGSPRGICTVYRCHITSIDDAPVSSPSLCLKLFDDRFQELDVPDENSELLTDEYLPSLFDSVVVAEAYALNEAFAYDKLLPAQGTVIPWFYGVHQFTLPNGTVLYGLLMEYIEGVDLDSRLVKDFSPDSQVNMIRSCRHATRVLDVADISQRDWHGGQILLCRNPETSIEHAVFIDFALTTQTWNTDRPNFIRNYFGVIRELLGSNGVGPFDQELVWKYFGDPDDWDPVHASLFRYSGDSKTIVNVVAREMFPYISAV